MNILKMINTLTKHKFHEQLYENIYSLAILLKYENYVKKWIL